MRFPLHTRLNTKMMAVVIVVIFIGQMAESTSFVFAALTALYLALWASAFNVAGGFEYTSGAYIFGSGFFSVLLGFGGKVILGEKAESNLIAPNTTLFVYTVAMLMTLVVAAAVRALRPSRGLIRDFKSLGELKQASIVSLIIGVALSAVFSAGYSGVGTALSAVAQINHFPQLSLMLATYYSVRHSGGKRSMNWIVKTSIGMSLLVGITYFGKEALVLPFATWAIAAAADGYDFKPVQIAALLVGFAFFNYYLVPYTQYVRNYSSATGSIRENIPVALEYLSDLPGTRRLYMERQERIDIANAGPHLYDEEEGFLDRLIQLPVDDALIDYTEQGHIFGLLPTYASYANVIPHFLWPNKPEVITGNMYSRELGLLPDSDTTTGISIGAPGDAFHQASWLGILLLLPFDLFVCFIVCDTVLGSVRDSPFVLVAIITVFGGAQGGGLSILTNTFTVEMEGILFAVFTLKVLAPRILAVIMPARQNAIAREAVSDDLVPVETPSM